MPTATASPTEPPEETQDDRSFLYVKPAKRDKSAWVRAAQREGKKLENWVIEHLNEAASERQD